MLKTLTSTMDFVVVFTSVPGLGSWIWPFCILAQDCDNAEITKLVKALCAEGNVSLIQADEVRSSLSGAVFASSTRMNRQEGCKCAVAVIIDYGTDSNAMSIVEKYVESMQ